MQDTLPNLQALRSVNKNNRPLTPTDPDDIIYVDRHQDPETKKDFVLWEDILVAFHDAVHVRHHARVVPFLKGADYRTYVATAHSFLVYLLQLRWLLKQVSFILLHFLVGCNRDGLQPSLMRFWMLL